MAEVERELGECATPGYLVDLNRVCSNAYFKGHALA